MKVADTTCS